MRYKAEHKVETRRRVLAEAARSIRTSGPDRVSVAEIMSGAGLTHGAFYAHFKSKDALVAGAIDEMFNDARRRLARSTADGSPAVGLARYIDFYLSTQHRDARGTGCPLPALSADLARLGPEARVRYGEGVDSLTRRLADTLALMGRGGAEAEAASVVAELVGAVALARAVSDPQQSDSILAASRTALRRRLNLEIAP